MALPKKPTAKPAVGPAEIICEVFLPGTGRGVRFAPLDQRIRMETAERAADSIGADASMLKLANAVQREQVATLVRAVTTRPMQLEFKPALETWEGKEDGVPQPPRAPDLEATFKKYRDDESAWRPLSYMQLIAQGPDHMLTLFSNPSDWDALVAGIKKSSGGVDSNPFAGQILKRTAG